MAIYSRCVNARQKLDEVLAEHFPWCKEWDGRTEAAFRRLRRPQGGGRRARLRRPAALLARPAGGGRRRNSRGETVRKLFDCVLVDEYQDTNTLQADILYAAFAGGQGVDRGGRRRPVDLRFPRRHGAQHSRLPQALPERHHRHAGAKLSQHAADSRGHQPRHRPGQGTLHQEPLVRTGRGRAAAAGQLRRRRRSGRVYHPPDSGASRGGHRPAPAGRAVPRVAPQHVAWRRNWPTPTSRSTSMAG